jgi:hypothetical protein
MTTAPPAAAGDAPAAGAGGGDAARAAAPRAPPGGALGRARSITLEPLSIAYYCTGHGLGHATRAIEVCKHLVERGHTVTVVTGAPARVFLQQVPAARFTLRKVRRGWGGGAGRGAPVAVVGVARAGPRRRGRSGRAGRGVLAGAGGPRHHAAAARAARARCPRPQRTAAARDAAAPLLSRARAPQAVLDCGSKQLDPFTVDTKGSLEEYYNTAVLHREELLAAEASRAAKGGRGNAGWALHLGPTRGCARAQQATGAQPSWAGAQQGRSGSRAAAAPLAGAPPNPQASWLRTTRTDLVVSDVVPIACAAAAQAGIPAVCVTNFSWGEGGGWGLGGWGGGG